MNPTAENLPNDLPANDLLRAPQAIVPMLLLQEGARQLGVPLDAGQVAQFELYYQQLVEWNQKFNLTAITGYQDVQVKHFLDCLAGVRILAEELKETIPFARPLACLDVGTGAGFPGVPLQLALPNLQWSLMDATGKKIIFLTQLLQKLGASETRVIQGRAEELGRVAEFRGRFDLVTARAVAPLNTLVEYLLPLVRTGGLAMIYKGTSAPQEFMAARKAIDLLGGEVVRLAPVQIPFLEEKRFILLIKKVRPTSNSYPRPQGMARKKPLGE